MRHTIFLLMVCCGVMIYPTQALGSVIDSSNAASLTLMETFNTTDAVYSLAWTPDNTTVVYGMANGDVGQDTWTAASITLPQMTGGHTDNVNGVAISQDGNFVYSGSSDGSVRVWDIATGTQLLASGIPSSVGSPPPLVLSVAAHPLDWNWFAYSGGNPAVDSPVRQVYWDIAGGGGLPNLTGHTNFVFDIAYDPSGNYLATGAADGTVRIYNAYTGGQMSSDSLSHTRRVRAIAFDRSGMHLASAGEDRMVWMRPVLSPGEPTLIDTLPDSPSGNWAIAVDFSLNGDLLAVGDGMGVLRVYALPGVLGVSPVLLTEINAHADQLHDLAFSPDGTMIATAGFDRTVKLWNVGGMLIEPPMLPVTCVDSPPSYFSVGMRGETVSLGDPIPLAVTPDGEVWTRLGAGVPFEVIEGPACALSMTWWKIRTDDGREGWLYEARGTTYYMSPLTEATGGLCPGAPPSLVAVGMRARVTFTDGTQLRIRRDPAGSRYSAMDEGVEFNIVGGPACADGYTWWEVQTDDGTRGWSAEGDADGYFMEPAPTGGGIISGYVWHDICNGLGGDGCVGMPDGSWIADGFHAMVEPSIGGVHVQIGIDGCAAFRPISESITREDGYYEFTGLDAGTYCVYVVPTSAQNSVLLIPGGWSFPIEFRNNEVAYAEVTLGVGGFMGNVDFGWDFQFSP